MSLIDFSGQAKGDNISLSWQTENEINCNHFEIEVSDDGNSFDKAGIIAARNVSGRNEYYFTGKASRASNTLLYRLKMVDIDGKFKYSNIIKLNNTTTSRLAVFPNPSSGVITISGTSSKGQVRLLNRDGKVLISKNVTAQSQTMDINLLAKGIYILQYIDGKKVLQQKIVK